MDQPRLCRFLFPPLQRPRPLPHCATTKSRRPCSTISSIPATSARIEQAPASNDEKLRQLRIILAILGSYRAAYNVAVIVGEPLQQELALGADSHPRSCRCRCETHKPGDGAACRLGHLVEGVIISVGDSETYSPAQRTLMANAITPHYPAISAVLAETNATAWMKALKPDERLALSAAP